MSVGNPHSELPADIYVDFTTGPSDVVVVLVHGSLDRSAGMARIAREVNKYAPVVRFDRRGYGKSHSHLGPFTVSGNADDLVDIIGEQKVLLFGHSFGGNVALLAAQRLPHLVVGVSTYETPLSWMPWWSGQSAGAAAIEQAPENAAEAFMVRLIGDKRWRELPEKTKESRRREGPALVGELSDLRAGPPWDARHITCPVIAGVGSKASAHHRQGAHWIANNVMNGALEVIEGAGHGAHVSHSQAVVDQLLMPHFQRLQVI